MRLVYLFVYVEVSALPIPVNVVMTPKSNNKPKVSTSPKIILREIFFLGLNIVAIGLQVIKAIRIVIS